MTFLEQLQAHKGGLIQLKSQLYWYGGRGSDGTPGRVCLILDASTAAATTASSTSTTAVVAACAATAATAVTAAAHLLIDGQTAWIWLAEQDIELLVNDPPTN
jgi:hypothetical protein